MRSRNAHQNRATCGVSSHSVSLLSCHRAQQVYCIQWLHPAGHPVTATALRDTIKHTPCISWTQTWDLEKGEGKISSAVQQRLKVFGTELCQWLKSNSCQLNYSVKPSQSTRNDVRQWGWRREKLGPGAVAKYVSFLQYGATVEHLAWLPLINSKATRRALTSTLSWSPSTSNCWTTYIHTYIHTSISTISS